MALTTRHRYGYDKPHCVFIEGLWYYRIRSNLIRSAPTIPILSDRVHDIGKTPFYMKYIQQ